MVISSCAFWKYCNTVANPELMSITSLIKEKSEESLSIISSANFINETFYAQDITMLEYRAM